VLFAKKTNAETSTMLDVKQAILTELGNEPVGTERYEKLLTELERVEKMITTNPSWSFTPSADALLNGALTILSILLITKNRHKNIKGRGNTGNGSLSTTTIGPVLKNLVTCV